MLPSESVQTRFWNCESCCGVTSSGVVPAVALPDTVNGMLVITPSVASVSGSAAYMTTVICPLTLVFTAMLQPVAADPTEAVPTASFRASYAIVYPAA